MARRAPEERIESFEAFWPAFVREHASPRTRRLHFLGKSLGLICAGMALTSGRGSLLLFAPIPGHAATWLSHVILRKSKPASFRHPLWSFKADWVMWNKMLQGTMDAEVSRLTEEGRFDEGGGSETEAQVSPAVVRAPINGVTH